jgi:hypothetical protein
MASIRRQRDRFEIRECRTTPNGPRQRTLARFDHVLTPEALDEAAAHASTPFDRDALIARARARGIPVAEHCRSGEARQLLAALRAGQRLQPSIVGLLNEALGDREARTVPPHLEDAAEWLGASDAARGKALRGLLRTASRVARSRGPLREVPRSVFPRFSTRPRS